MKISTLKKGLLACSLLALTMSCSDSDGPTPNLPGSEKYVLITMSENSLDKPGYVTAFNELPDGEISNATDSSLQGMGFGGWRTEGNRLLKMFSTESNSLGIEELVIDATGKVQPGAFLAAANKPNGSGNFVILDETRGFTGMVQHPWPFKPLTPQHFLVPGRSTSPRRSTNRGRTIQKSPSVPLVKSS